jgi:hypothetical protein
VQTIDGYVRGQLKAPSGVWVRAWLDELTLTVRVMVERYGARRSVLLAAESAQEVAAELAGDGPVDVTVSGVRRNGGEARYELDLRSTRGVRVVVFAHDDVAGQPVFSYVDRQTFAQAMRAAVDWRAPADEPSEGER